MKKGKTVYEERAEKEAARKAKAQARMERHVVPCPHCGERVLDHMTQCPHCKGAITPSGYYTRDDKKVKRIRYICYGVGIAVAIVVVVLFFVLK